MQRLIARVTTQHFAGAGPDHLRRPSAADPGAELVVYAGGIGNHAYHFLHPIAATQFYDPATGRYRARTENREVDAAEWATEMTEWCSTFPTLSLEDPSAD